MASNSGYNWEVSDTDFKPFIYTDGVQVFLKNRCACYGDQVAGDVHGFYEKMWLTQGFENVDPGAAEMQVHGEGAIAFLYDQNYELILYEFAAQSGHTDASVEDMLDKVMKLAGGEARFPGDITEASKTLSSTAWEIGT